MQTNLNLLMPLFTLESELSLLPHSGVCSCSLHVFQIRTTHEGWMTLLSSLSPDSQSLPLVRGGLLGSVRVPQGSATCMTWGGTHYRTFDRKHFHFQGSCTYLFASSTDGTWAVYISTVCDGRGDCSKVRKNADSKTDGVWQHGINLWHILILSDLVTVKIHLRWKLTPLLCLLHMDTMRTNWTLQSAIEKLTYSTSFMYN